MVRVVMADFSLHGKVAMVTGASRGIGAGIAVEFAAHGAAVAVTARQRDTLVEVCQRIEALGQKALPIALEVTDLTSIEMAVMHIEQQLGAIDILVNNAGINIPRPAMDVTEAQWDQILDTNLKGVFFCSQVVAKGMIERQHGKLINISSAAGLIAATERAAYGASKAGLIHLTRILALEWAQHHITVNAVAPTFVETELAAQTLNRPGLREYWTNRIPLERLGTIEDVAAAVVYLASPAADFVTGIVLSVDGGVAMR
jgi:2-deoxy-D-gluconate 3-dehydrogenase